MLMFTKLFGILLFVVYMFLSARGIAQERVVSKKKNPRSYRDGCMIKPSSLAWCNGESCRDVNRNFHERERLV